MKPRFVLAIALVALLGIGGFSFYLDEMEIKASTAMKAPAAPVRDVQSEQATRQYIAALDVARVFGRSQGCENADPKLITSIAVESLNDNLDPRILAATVAVESACDPLAVSPKGALGLTQVMPKIWKGKFDFTGTVNLLNPNDNIHAGATILSDLIKQYGVAAGVRRYNGVGVGCETCDGGYVSKIIALAGKR